MRARVVTMALAAVTAVAALSAPGVAGAADTGVENTSAGASVSGGTISVSAGVTSWTPPAGSPIPVPHGTTTSGGQPSPCTYQVAGAATTALLGAGGPGAGHWVYPTCRTGGAIDPLAPFWVHDTAAAPPPVPAPVNPVAVAHEAASHLALGSPTIEMAPPAGANQLVIVPTWLWIDPAAWHPLSATASVGAVAATATATPASVTWTMGDGHQITCPGPGMSYDPATPDATTNCSYAWPEVGTFRVTATISWAVSWTATGAPGGGSFGTLPGPAASVTVTVVASQAINTPNPGSG